MKKFICDFEIHGPSGDLVGKGSVQKNAKSTMEATLNVTADLMQLGAYRQGDQLKIYAQLEAEIKLASMTQRWAEGTNWDFKKLGRN